METVVLTDLDCVGDLGASGEHVADCNFPAIFSRNTSSSPSSNVWLLVKSETQKHADTEQPTEKKSASLEFSSTEPIAGLKRVPPKSLRKDLSQSWHQAIKARGKSPPAQDQGFMFSHVRLQLRRTGHHPMNSAFWRLSKQQSTFV